MRQIATYIKLVLERASILGMQSEEVRDALKWIQHPASKCQIEEDDESAACWYHPKYREPVAVVEFKPASPMAIVERVASLPFDLDDEMEVQA